jgi:ABC-type amino acid transport substrate-binding protein
MKRRIPALRMITCFLAVLCLTVQAAYPALAEESGRQTVKVAVLNHSTYANQDASGEWSGLDIECMISIAQKAGFDLQFIDSTTDQDYLGGLDDGRYDIVADVVNTPERAREYLFTEEAIGSTNSTMAVRADDDRWDYGNIEQISRMKVGVIASYAYNAAFRAWCAEHDVTPEITEYRDIEQMSAALLDKQIDAEVYTAIYSTDDSAGLRTVMKLLPETFYYAFRLDNTELKNKVDDALAQLLATNPNFLTDIKNKYEEKFSVNDLPFSAAEKEYIAAHPQMTIAVIRGDAPYYIENTDGSAGGIFPDYYALVAENTGFRFRYAAYDTQQDAISAVKNGEADILGVYSGGIISSQKDGLVLTDSIAVLNSILLTKSGSGSPQIKSIAVKLRALGSLSGSIAQTFPDAELKEYENAETCRSALERGEVSAVLIGLPSATWIINQTNSSTYDIRPVAGAVSNMCGAVSSDDLILCSILNKRIAITKISFPGIVAKDTLPKNDLKTTIARVPPTWTILIFFVLLCLVLFLVWTMILLRRRQKERTAVLTAQAETKQQRLQLEAIEKMRKRETAFLPTSVMICARRLMP